jgi:hypothetical protein
MPTLASWPNLRPARLSACAGWPTSRYVPEAAITPGGLYDVLFLENRLVVFANRQAKLLAEVPYNQVEDVEIGGPGLVKTGDGFVGGGFGVSGAVEGMAIAAVLNTLTTRTSVKTIVQIQGTTCELFLLHTELAPEQLRIAMSRAAWRHPVYAGNAGGERHPARGASCGAVTSPGADQAGRHAGKGSIDPRRIRFDEGQAHRSADHLIRRSGHIVRDRPMWSVRWGGSTDELSVAERSNPQNDVNG